MPDDRGPFNPRREIVMAQQPGGVRNKVVTLESLQPPPTDALEAVPSEELSLENRLRSERHNQIMERLRQKTQPAGSNLMITVQDREASILQSELARQAAEGKALDSGGLEA